MANSAQNPRQSFSWKQVRLKNIKKKKLQELEGVAMPLQHSPFHCSENR